MKIHPSAFAVAVDGSIVVNVAGYFGARDPQKLLKLALADGGVLFVGVRLHAAEARDLLRFLDELAYEPTGYILGARNRRRRNRAARKGSK